MTREEFANFLLFTFANDTVDPNRNKTLAKMQSALKQNPTFYENIPDVKYLEQFRKQVQFERIDADENVLTSKSFWNQPDEKSFTYVLRVLPLVKKNYPEAYDKIVNSEGEIILPAGVDKESLQQPNKKTIYNVVASYDAKNSKSNNINTSSSLAKKFNNLSLEQQTDFIRKNLKELDKNLNTINVNDDAQLANVAKFISNFLKNY